mmetsp:Transcript_45572/g.103260  ORF Transcript_45572/g.103260 Transcript_45572/m.103260 type:complete len:158 (+) Transcript_45572:216-689(+)
MNAAKTLAKDLVRCRKHQEKFIKMKANLQAVQLRMQTLKSTEALARAMKGVTAAMGKMNQQMNIPAITQMMREFEKQSNQMEMTEDMMNDAVDGVMDDGEDEAEEDEVLNKVLMEIGIDVSQQLSAAPTASLPAAQQGVAQAPAEMNLEERLAALKR